MAKPNPPPVDPEPDVTLSPQRLHRSPTTHRLAQLVRFVGMALLALFFCRSGHAAPYAQVMQLSVPDPRGQWSFVDATGAARVLRGETPEALRVGMPIEISETLRTERARVVLRLSTGETLVISEGTEIVLGDRSVVQVIGEVYYQLKNSFSIEYRTVRATIEGTELLVTGSEPERVIVTRGKVRVSGLEDGPVTGEVLVEAGKMVAIPTSGALAEAKRWSLADRQLSLSQSWSLGRPWILLGASTGGGLDGSTAIGQAHLNARLALPKDLRLVVDGGINTGFGDAALGIPVGWGIEWEKGLFSTGLLLSSELALSGSPCGSTGLLHLGALGVVRSKVYLTRNLGLELSVRGGHSGDWTADAGLGLITAFH